MKKSIIPKQLQLFLWNVAKSLQSESPKPSPSNSHFTKSRFIRSDRMLTDYFSAPRKRRRPSSPLNCPTLHPIWCALVNEYFPETPHLLEYTVHWSRRRQLRTLASCNIHDRRVSVAQELQYQEYQQWLSPLLYHEMCHAYFEFAVPKRNGKSQWHGQEFRSLEHRHPKMKEFDIWIRNGGWARAVRSHRSKVAHAKRRQLNS
ncbi:MAG: SprT-like domain-containing protein [Bdellovibrionales bacterium]|nr:SprT-like domain-containing protein [Bdellovibrionales bacterium]